MTDKATVEIPPPVDGEVICLTGKLGDIATFGAGVSARWLRGYATTDANVR